jgi:hypothetical protein
MTDLQEKLPAEMTYEEILEQRENANHIMEQIKASVDVLNEELKLRLTEEKISGKVVGNWAISKATRVSFDIPLEEAEALGATKMVVDQTKLKSMLKKGVAIPGIKKSEYIIVRAVEKEDTSIIRPEEIEMAQFRGSPIDPVNS